MRLPVRVSKDETTYTEVDPVDFLWASQFCWHLSAGYVARAQRRGHENKPYRMFLHREILGLKHSSDRSRIVDHINGNPLDNRRRNLRVITPSGNAHNRKGQNLGKRTSSHRGVSWFTAKDCWRVQVMTEGKRTLVGYYDDEDEAARAAYDFYAENVPLANVTAPSGPGTASSIQADVQPSGPGRSAIPDHPET